MAMERFRPSRSFTSLRDAIDQLFEESFLMPRRGGGAAGRSWFPMDVADKDDHVEVTAEIPGLKSDDIHIDVQGNLLRIRGDKTQESEREEDNWVIKERESTSFSRSVTLPAHVESEKSEARYENGVLKLTLPKREKAATTQIKVK
ncbi:MAG: Hsp20/alpha crystallin family protein [Chloroflexota bacterium]